MKFLDIFRPAPVVTAVRLSGVISSGRRGLNLEHLSPLLRRAFTFPRVRAVALLINSPGGSPVQSDLLARRIRALAAEHKVPVFAFCEDVAASGGYWLACAADEVYALPSSIVGSIGVISAGFGMQGLIERFGVERRVHTAGESKSTLDPFRPEDPEDVAHLQEILNQTHGHFQAYVRDRRGARLKGDPASLFSGTFWTGDSALPLGLIDGIGDARAVLRGRFGERVQVHLVDDSRSRLLKRLGLDALSPTHLAPTHLATDLLACAEARALWARFGL